MRKIFDLAREKGFSSICLNVNKKNISAITAYERNGFAKHKEVIDDIGGGYVTDDYIMLKELTSNTNQR